MATPKQERPTQAPEAPAPRQTWLELANARREAVACGQVAMVRGDEALARIREWLRQAEAAGGSR